MPHLPNDAWLTYTYITTDACESIGLKWEFDGVCFWKTRLAAAKDSDLNPFAYALSHYGMNLSEISGLEIDILKN